MIRGIIDRVESFGTVVMAWLNVGDEKVVPIHFDHRPFLNMCEARGSRGILGADVVYDSDEDGQPTIRFLDEEEAV